MSHLRGRKHREALKTHYGGKEPSREQSERSNLKFIVEAGTQPKCAPAKENGENVENAEGTGSEAAIVETDKEKRAKALKKRVKKLKSKVMQNANASETGLATAEGSNR